ncbi:MAG: sugar phosphate nucleotidyltransferase, partial [Roseburia sp.]|nr:sugar phosphate nucleotidyltransferase [Roseburia sp.]
MKVVILAGGLPSTLIEQDEKIPKPMAEIGGRPILWHIMKQYAYYGYKEFIICTGYKGEMIKDYFMNFYIYQSDITVDLQTNQVDIHRKKTEDWDVMVVDTGRNASVSERIRSVREYLQGDTFLLTYGDCVSDIDISEMVVQHKKEGKTVTFAAANPTGRNKIIPVGEDGKIQTQEKGNRANAWVNACSMVMEQGIFQYLKVNEALLEGEMLSRLIVEGQVSMYCHKGFWSPMETVRDKTLLENMW